MDSKVFLDLQERYPEYRAVRVWKRDGTRNVMSLASAAMNLESRGRFQTTAREAAALLWAGEALETPLAFFRLYGIWNPGRAA